ncbi:hypothetical protein BJ138DRAFT_1153235 [Hygrophoropsis aurantiaca]|uniref:Uncharacterized protein n=1 Tax=Hygrophoropsis aurantiaca TaxID=72124 RepID=A0ACB8AB87_9AGAM|nr:hypothetical protein BJ138DRAFT_1153235 [Hygrophoropsis aurantiaca]
MARYSLPQWIRVGLLGVVTLIVLSGLLYRRHVTRSVMALHFPPLYETIHEQEQQLPHYKDYETSPIKYFWASNHLSGLGWGNVMQDYVMMSLLARATNRSFVFNDYTWNADGSWYSDYNGKLIPSRIPLSAIISGPVVGGELPPEDNIPRAVSRDFFRTVCPNPTILQVSDVNDDHMRYDESVPAAYILDKWIEKINSIDDPCVQLGARDGQIFDYWMYGQKRLLSLWPSLSESPILKRWCWSPLIHNAYEINRNHFHASPPLFSPEPLEPDVILDAIVKEDYSQPIPGLLAIHIRRGDFEPHCKKLSTVNADWNAFNSFPGFLDQFSAPQDNGDHVDLYMPHCYPSMEQIVEKVKAVREGAKETLTHLYIMTNGPAPWVEELKKSFALDSEWEQISSSRDLTLTWEQKFISQGLDMFVAQRAQILIGNGWSSLTSNVVMLRMAHGMPSDSNRFW